MIIQPPAYSLLTNEIITFKSTKKAGKILGISSNTIANVCRKVKHFNTYKNYIFRYIGQ